MILTHWRVLINKLLILTLLFCIQCGPALSPLEEHAKKIQQEFEQKQFSNFWRFYFLNKTNHIYYRIYDLNKNTNIRILYMDSFTSIEVTLTEKRMLKRLIAELQWKIETTSRMRMRKIHPSWFGFLYFLKEVKQGWQEEK